MISAFNYIFQSLFQNYKIFALYKLVASKSPRFIQQLMNEAEQDRGGCYQGKPKAVDNTLRDLLNSAFPRKPNSLIALLFIQNNSYFINIAKTCLPTSMLSSSSIVFAQVCPAPQIFSKKHMSPSELCSCCFCYVFYYYFAWFQL